MRCVQCSPVLYFASYSTRIKSPVYSCIVPWKVTGYISTAVGLVRLESEITECRPAGNWQEQMRFAVDINSCLGETVTYITNALFILTLAASFGPAFEVHIINHSDTDSGRGPVCLGKWRDCCPGCRFAKHLKSNLGPRPYTRPENGAVNRRQISDSDFWCRVFVPEASGMKISDAENKRACLKAT